MKTSGSAILATLAILFGFDLALGQQANQPKYKQGDWWRVKTEHDVKDSSRNASCQDSYREWVVKIDEKGLAHLYGINDGKEVDAICDSVLGWVFGVNETKMLKFPLSVGQTWTHMYERAVGKRAIRVEPQYKVTALEKVQTPKGTFEAFKIIGAAKWWVQGRGDYNFNNWTEYYSPTIKAMVLSEIETVASKRRVVLVDFNVAN